ncbi:unnamed protein product [Prorocentrum cordatum]|uniref:Uncharacterized protein n=1 Tax=Prorocentrum cordatum TaxID=2364126 RepID=A0ABN9UNF9_9DINO|nr:unnamed protein product [Polarella glacialis]
MVGANARPKMCEAPLTELFARRRLLHAHPSARTRVLRDPRRLLAVVSGEDSSLEGACLQWAGRSCHVCLGSITPASQRADRATTHGKNNPNILQQGPQKVCHLGCLCDGREDRPLSQATPTRSTRTCRRARAGSPPPPRPAEAAGVAPWPAAVPPRLRRPPQPRPGPRCYPAAWGALKKNFGSSKKRNVGSPPTPYRRELGSANSTGHELYSGSSHERSGGPPPCEESDE